jgi:hypothetical protein
MHNYYKYLNFYHFRFICEVRKQDCTEYPPKTLYELVIALQMFLAKNGKEYRFLHDGRFVQIKNTLDNKMAERTRAGGKKKPRKCDILTEDHEEKLWSLGLLGDSDPTKLLNTLVYQLGLNFALRAADEHRNLRHNAQIEIRRDVQGGRFLRYTEDVSKTNQGGILHKDVKGKVVDAYESTNEGRCVVRLFEKYVSKCPQKNRPDAFYLRPLQKCGRAGWANIPVWYACAPVGVNTLGSVVKRLCQEAQLEGFFTNHSLRATAATRLFRSGMSEQVVCETTGHRSATAVREYQRSGEVLKRSASAIVQGTGVHVEAPVVPAKREVLSVNSGEFSFNITINVNKM